MPFLIYKEPTNDRTRQKTKWKNKNRDEREDALNLIQRYDVVVVVVFVVECCASLWELKEEKKSESCSVCESGVGWLDSAWDRYHQKHKSLQVMLLMRTLKTSRSAARPEGKDILWAKSWLSLAFYFYFFAICLISSRSSAKVLASTDTITKWLLDKELSHITKTSLNRLNRRLKISSWSFLSWFDCQILSYFVFHGRRVSLSIVSWLTGATWPV